MKIHRKEGDFGFKPFTIEIVVETEDEKVAIQCITQYCVRIPEFIYRLDGSGPVGSPLRLQMERFLRKLYDVVTKTNR